MTDFVDDAGVSEGQQPELASGGSLDNLLGSPDKVVSARGTEEGLILRIDGRAEWAEILGDLETFLGGRRKFFEGGEVSVEWLERLPTKEQSQELETLLREHYGIEIVARRKKPPKLSEARNEPVSERQEKRSGGVTIPLFDEVPGEGKKPSLADGIESLTFSGAGAGDDLFGSSVPGHKRYLNRMASIFGEELCYEEDANAKVVFGTLRSGQRLETPFSLIVVGDVNPGADLVAGGDIIVLGSLRGTAHASAYDEESLDQMILALKMQPMQLRIGSVISRGSAEAGRGAEIARIENRRIIVEPFNARALATRRAK